MTMHDFEASTARRRLSSPIDGLHEVAHGLDRRRFLQAVAGVGFAAGTVGLPTLDRLTGGDQAWAVSPVGPTDGILVSIFMYGGNDALDTLVRPGDADYRRYHGALALDPAQVLMLDAEVGVHPRLTFLKQQYDLGQVAFVEGIGAPGGDLSHFTSQARWLGGSAGAGAPSSGWIGRWLDGLDSDDPFRAVTIGSTIPLSVVGRVRRGVAVPTFGDGFGAGTSVPDRLMYDAVRAFSAAGAGRGAWHDAIAATEATQLSVVGTMSPLLEAALPDGAIERRLAIAARLVNADLGVRVVDVGWGDFDTHRDQLLTHDRRMGELDAALRQFFGAVDPRFRSRVTVMIVSEFGRTPWANDSGGTDHGEAGVAMLVGDAVKGGRHGEAPSLAGLGRWDQLTPTVDFRSLYTEVLGRWLGADPVAVIGASYDALDLFERGPGSDQPDTTPAPVTVPAPTPAPAPPQTPVELAGDFVPLNPQRLLDTRNGLGRSGPLGAAVSFDLDVVGVGGVPESGVTAVALNVTATAGDTASYLTVYPAGEARPEASSVNWAKGATVPNLVIMRPGSGGSVSLWNATGGVHLLADVVGYFRDTTSDRFVPASPARVLDTRTGVGTARGRLAAGRTLDLVPSSVPGSGVAVGVDAVVLNVTVDAPSKAGYVTVWPTGEPRFEVSSLNFEAGQTVANLVIAKLGAGGSVSVFNAAGDVDVLADVVGSFSSDGLGRHHSTSPTRVLDTRNGIGVPSALGTSVVTLPLAGSSPVPNGATGVVMNVTVTGPTAQSYLTVWPQGEPRPTASSLNYRADTTVANLVIARLGTDGGVHLANDAGSTHVLADVVGYFV